MRISVSVGRGFQSSRALALINMPGVQKPQCTASWSRKDSCKRMQLAVLRQAFHGHDLAPVNLRSQDQAGVDRLAIEQDRAGAALADFAAALGAQQTQVIAQQIKQRGLAGTVRVRGRPLIVVVMRHSLGRVAISAQRLWPGICARSM